MNTDIRHHYDRMKAVAAALTYEKTEQISDKLDEAEGKHLAVPSNPRIIATNNV